MGKSDVTRMIRAARAAHRRAVAPYSKFPVGAALLMARGRVIAGANVKSASYGPTCCAERVALFKALTEGERDFKAIAVVARKRGGATPCGACRQLLAECAPNAAVYIADILDPAKFRTCAVSELLPAAFSLSNKKV